MTLSHELRGRGPTVTSSQIASCGSAALDGVSTIDFAGSTLHPSIRSMINFDGSDLHPSIRHMMNADGS